MSLENPFNGNIITFLKLGITFRAFRGHRQYVLSKGTFANSIVRGDEKFVLRAGFEPGYGVRGGVGRGVLVREGVRAGLLEADAVALVQTAVEARRPDQGDRVGRLVCGFQLGRGIGSAWKEKEGIHEYNSRTSICLYEGGIYEGGKYY